MTLAVVNDNIYIGDTMLYRKFLKKLLDWKENDLYTPFILIGARQTGKTYILNYFCQNYFQNYIYINFEKEKEYLKFFEKNLDPERIISEIETFLGKKINIDNTIIFFDEIQVSEKVISSLKYFNESQKKYKIVCAGSLLGVKINRFKSSFPVGKVKFEYLYPLDFEEFLIAIGEDLLNESIKKSFNKMKPLAIPLHEKAITLYKHFLCVGGMPVSILEYINKNKDLVSFNSLVQSDIITAYLADMAKYTERLEAVKTYEIYNSIPEQLTKENKKFIYKVVNPKARSKSYASSINWLLQGGLLLQCLKLKKPEKPLKIYEEKTSFKLYLSDVGLLTNLADFNYYDILNDEGSEFKGVLAENYVAQTFKSSGKNLNYWGNLSTSEIDFIVNIDNNIIPIEVKANKNVRSYSLTYYIKKYNPKYGIRISLKNFGFVNNIKSIPLYAVYLIK